MSTAPITSVTLLEDRAYITRRLPVKLEAGQHSLSIAEVTPILADKTLSLKSSVAEHPIIVRELKVERSRLGQPTEELHQEMQKLAEKKARLASQKTALSSHLKALRELGALQLQEMREDVSWGRVEPESWSLQLESLKAEEQKLDSEFWELHEREEEYKREARELYTKTSGETPKPTEVNASVVALVEVEEGFEGDLELTYCVPGACWRPYHRAEIRENRLTFISSATVWQNTSEDWNQVELKLSTQRSAKTTVLPKLTEDQLSLVDHEREIVLESREESVNHLEPNQGPTIPVVPGIDDGGERLLLSAAESLTLPSHGRPQRSELFRFETEIELGLLARPEALSKVVSQSKQTNGSGRPLLAGPVDLVKEGAMVGTTWIDFVAPEQRFDLTWGAERSVSIKRRHQEKEEKEKLLKGWVATTVVVDLYLSNLSGREQTVTITERVPVSESEDVKVEYDGSNSYGKAPPDKNGFLEWVVTLPPEKRRKMTLRYTTSRRKKASYA